MRVPVNDGRTWLSVVWTGTIVSVMQCYREETMTVITTLFLIVADSGFGRSSRAGACVYRP